MRFNRLGVFAAVILAGVAVPAHAQTRDRWMEQQEARIRAELNELQAKRRPRVQPRVNVQSERMSYDMQERMREQSIRMQEQQERMREQQQRIHEQQLERAQAQRERDLERAQEIRERTLERAREQRERDLERAQEARERAQEIRERAQEQRERMMEAQANRDAGRRIYITPPPSVKFRNRWP